MLEKAIPQAGEPSRGLAAFMVRRFIGVRKAGPLLRS
jgi:hypothetical protein